MRVERSEPQRGGPPGDGHIPEGEVRCKLLRGDGTEWTVTALSLEPDGLRVSAYRYELDDHLDADTAHRHRLEDERLAPDDRVKCLNRRGSVVWTLARPADGPDSGKAAP